MKLVRTYNLNFVLALRQGVDFVLPLSQEDQEDQEEKPPPNISAVTDPILTKF